MTHPTNRYGAPYKAKATDFRPGDIICDPAGTPAGTILTSEPTANNKWHLEWRSATHDETVEWTGSRELGDYRMTDRYNYLIQENPY